MEPMINYINDLKESARKKRLEDLLKRIADAESSQLIQLPPFVKKTRINRSIDGIDKNCFYNTRDLFWYKYELTNIEEVSEQDLDAVEEILTFIDTEKNPNEITRKQIESIYKYTKTIKGIMVFFTVLWSVGVLIWLIVLIVGASAY